MIKLNHSPVLFFSETHQYFLGEKELSGITSLISKIYPKTYEGVPQDVLTRAAQQGSLTHETIELYDEMGIDSELPELKSYKKVINDYGLSVVATEYIVSDEERYATAIDKVMQDVYGNIILVDLKRTYKIHEDNVRLQLSICKYLFELQNPDLKVAKLFVLRLRNDDVNFQELNPVSDAFLHECLDYKDGDIIPVETELSCLSDAENNIVDLENNIKMLKERKDKLMSGLYDIMEKNNIKSWEGKRIKLTRVMPQTKSTFDAKSFKDDNPEEYAKYLRESETKGSVRITIKKDED